MLISICIQSTLENQYRKWINHDATFTKDILSEKENHNSSLCREHKDEEKKGRRHERNNVTSLLVRLDLFREVGDGNEEAGRGPRVREVNREGEGGQTER